MKTKALLLICLFIGNGITQLSAQNPPGSEIGKGAKITHSEDVYCGVEVYCDSCTYEPPKFNEKPDYIDLLTGYVSETLIGVVGNGYMGFMMIHGILTSNNTGEVFQFNYIDKAFFDSDAVEVVERINLVGNNGTHYILTITFYFQLDIGWLRIFYDANCPPNKE